MATSMAPLAQMIMELGRTGEKMQESFQRGREIRRAEEDRQLQRRKIEMGIEQDEQMFPYKLEAARREAAMAGQPKMTEKARQVQELVNEGIPRQTAVAQVYGTERTYTDPQTGNIVSYNPLESYFTELGAKTSEQQAQAAEIMGAEERGEIEPVDTIGMVARPTTEQQPDVPPGGRVLAEGTKEEERRAAQEEKQYKRTREFKQDVTAYGDKYAKANIGVMEGELSNAEKLLQEHATTEVVPGRGPIERFAPSFLKSKEGREFTQTMQSNFNRMLKERSGAAVTEQEFQRLAKEAGVDTFDTQDQVITGIRLWRQALENTRKQLYGTADPEVASEYEKRSDLRARPFTPELARDKALDKEKGKYTYAPEAELPNGKRIYRLGPNQPWRYADGTIYVQPPAGQSDATQGRQATNEVAQTTPEQDRAQDPAASADPTQQAVGILQDQLNKGVSKQAVLNTLNEMRADGTIDMKQYRKIVRELQLGTFDTSRRAR